MATRETIVETARKYGKIPYGGKRVLTAFVIIPVMALYLGREYLFPLIVKEEMVDMVSVFATVVIGYFGAHLFMTNRDYKNPIEFFIGYITRNIRGYYLRVWLSKVGDAAASVSDPDKRIGFQILNWRSNFLEGEDVVALDIALGGWFRRSHWTLPNGAVRDCPLGNWTVKYVAPVTGARNLYVKLRFRNRYHKLDERVQLELWMALRMLQNVWTISLPSSLGGIVRQFHYNLNRAERLQEETRTSLAEHEQRVQALEPQLADAIREYESLARQYNESEASLSEFRGLVSTRDREFAYMTRQRDERTQNMVDTLKLALDHIEAMTRHQRSLGIMRLKETLLEALVPVLSSTDETGEDCEEYRRLWSETSEKLRELHNKQSRKRSKKPAGATA